MNTVQRVTIFATLVTLGLGLAAVAVMSLADSSSTGSLIFVFLPLLVLIGLTAIALWGAVRSLRQIRRG